MTIPLVFVLKYLNSVIYYSTGWWVDIPSSVKVDVLVSSYQYYRKEN